MGENFILTDDVTLAQALVVTLFSMGIVFVTLLVISFMLDGFKAVLFTSPTEKEAVKKVKQPASTPSQVENPVVEQDEEELVAVITAAIASSLSKPVDQIIVRNIIRVPDDGSAWSRAGLQEQIYNK